MEFLIKKIAQLITIGAIVFSVQSTAAENTPRTLLGSSEKIPLIEQKSNSIFAKNYQAIQSQVQSKGTARIIIGMRVPFAPAGNLTADSLKIQTQEIKAAQQAILNYISATNNKNKKPVLFDTIPFMALEVTQAELDLIIRNPDINHLEEDKVGRTQLSQSTPLIGMASGNFSGFTGSGQSVAILDTGVDKNHPDLSGRVVSEACYSTTSGTTATSLCPGGSNSTATNSALPYANGVCGSGGCDHGTHVAATAAGATGVARGSNIIAVQVFSWFPGLGDARVYWSDLILGLERVYALRTSYNIAAVNMSLGGGRYYDQPTCDADNASLKATIDNLRSAGIASVIASGNDGYSNSMGTPGCISSAVSVGATWDQNGGSNSCESGSVIDRVTCYSNSASFLNLLAPGSLINAAIPNGGYGNWNGTSMATPHVAGAWAVLKSKQPSATVPTVLSALTSTGVSVTDTRNSVTKPRINVGAAINAIGATGNTLSLTIGGTGGGSVTSAPAGISCSASCSGVFSVGQTVTLTATPSNASTFAGWSGACAGTSTCSVTMSAARAVTATFTAKPLITALNLTNLSGVQANGNLANVLRYQVTVPAGAANLTISISGGTGDADLYVRKDSPPDYNIWDCVSELNGNNDSCSVNTAAPRSLPNPPGVYHIMLSGWTAFAGVTLTVTYNADPTLSVVKVGNGTVTSSPAGISCGTDCTETLPVNSLVTLTATPGPRSRFVGWSGGKCVGAATTCAFTVTNNQTETATFRTENSITPILLLLLD